MRTDPDSGLDGLKTACASFDCFVTYNKVRNVLFGWGPKPVINELDTLFFHDCNIFIFLKKCA